MRVPLTLLSILLWALSSGAKGKHTLDFTTSLSAVADGYCCIDSVRERMSHMPLHEIEGIWQLTGDGGSIIAIERIPSTGASDGLTVYRIAVIESSEISVLPGTVIGYMAPSAKAKQYDARIYTSRSDDYTILTHPTRNLLTLSADGTHLTFRPTSLKLRLNWWRLLLPYLYRSLVSPSTTDRQVEDGCVRLYPTPLPPLNPRYL